MINKKTVSSASNNSSSNFLSSAVTIKGNFTSDQDVTIAGTIHGDVHVKGLLKMEKNGFVKGKIFTVNADISGKIDGIINCEKLAIIRNSAVIRANIQTKSLQVDADAKIEGQIQMSKNESAIKKN